MALYTRLLLLLYINDISNSNNLFNFIIYPDDTVLSKPLEIVIEDLKLKLRRSPK